MEKIIKNKKKWKKFEDSSHNVIKQLNPKLNVIKNVFIEGRLSKVKRQVDVKVEELNQYDFIAFECKDYKRTIDVPVIEAFNTKLQDISAKKGAIVSNSPFSEASQNMAEQLSIDLLNLVDTSNKNVKGKLYAGLLISDTFCRWCSAKISISAPTSGTFPSNIKDMILQDEDGNRGTAYEIFSSLWNSENCPFDRSVGTHQYGVNGKSIVSLEGEVVPLDEFSFIYEVVKRNYLDKIEIIKAKGLYNVKEKSFQTRGITTQIINAYEFEKTAKELTLEEVEKANGQYTFGLECTSLFRPSNNNGSNN